MTAERRRILITTTAYPPSVGGVQSHIAELRARLRRYEDDVATLWLHHRTDWLLGTTLRLGDGVATQPVPGVTVLGWSAETRRRMAPWVFSYYAYPAVAARRVAALMVPYVERLLRPDHVLIAGHRIGREFLARASLTVARRHGIPFVLTSHHHPKWRGYRYAGWTDVYRESDAVLAHTNAERDELQRLGVRPERIHVIWAAADPPLPADPGRFRARIGGREAPVVLFLGQLYSYKGVAELVQAVASLQSQGRKAELVFIGPATPFSREFFARQSHSWLHVLGVVDVQTKWDAIEAASVVVLPSRHEAFGRVYLEGWSKGKPVIGGRIPAVADVVTEGKTGLLVDPTSAEELAAAIRRILDDPGFAATLGANGRREVESRFSWDAVVDRVEAAYDSVLQAVRTAAAP